jgi:hypothetical protein
MKQQLIGLSVATGLVLATAFIVQPAFSGSTPKPAAVVQKECGACHMAYLAEFLPARSWNKLIDGLKEHFGENAALDAATSKVIRTYLVAHAADAAGQDHRFTYGLDKTVTPLRVSDTPYWVMRHSEIPAEVFTHPKVKTKANCIACHQNADKGGFEDE